MTDIDALVEGIESLRPIPPVAIELMDLLEGSESSPADIAELIMLDPSITANLLKLCNSAFFGLCRKVDSVQEAVTLVGLDQIAELVLLHCMAGFLKGKQEGYGLGEGELWRHAVISAKVAGILAQKCNHSRDRHRIFTAALLKDIGKLVLGRFVAFSYERINISVQSKGASFNEAEKDIIGISHEELGAQIAERWRFSDQMIFNIRHHHLLDASARDHVETILIYLADMVCMMMGVHAGVDGLAYRFYGEVLTAMHLTEKDLQTVMVETLQMRDHIEDMLKLF